MWPRIPDRVLASTPLVRAWVAKVCPYGIITTNRKSPVYQGLIVIRYYLALRGAENGVTAMVTPFFCVQG